MAVGGMDPNWWRAVKQALKDFKNSKFARWLGEEGIRAFLREALPHIWEHIKHYIHEIWQWFVQNGPDLIG